MMEIDSINIFKSCGSSFPLKRKWVNTNIEEFDYSKLKKRRIETIEVQEDETTTLNELMGPIYVSKFEIGKQGTTCSLWNLIPSQVQQFEQIGQATVKHKDNSMGLENRLKLEAGWLRSLEGANHGHSARLAKDKPKIEAYDKDKKKGTGGSIIPTKTYNPSADSILGQNESSTDKDEIGGVNLQWKQWLIAWHFREAGKTAIKIPWRIPWRGLVG